MLKMDYSLEEFVMDIYKVGFNLSLCDLFEELDIYYEENRVGENLCKKIHSLDYHNVHKKCASQKKPEQFV